MESLSSILTFITTSTGSSSGNNCAISVSHPSLASLSLVLSVLSVDAWPIKDWVAGLEVKHSIGTDADWCSLWNTGHKKAERLRQRNETWFRCWETLSHVFPCNVCAFLPCDPPMRRERGISISTEGVNFFNDTRLQRCTSDDLLTKNFILYPIRWFCQRRVPRKQLINLSLFLAARGRCRGKGWRNSECV